MGSCDDDFRSEYYKFLSNKSLKKKRTVPLLMYLAHFTTKLIRNLEHVSRRSGRLERAGRETTELPGKGLDGN